MHAPTVRRHPLVALALALALGPATALAQQPAHGPQGHPGRTDAGGPRDAGRSPADEARRAAVVARVNGTAVTVGEFEDLLNEAPAPVRATYTDPGRRRETLENLVQTMLLADEARRRGLDREPQVSAAVRRILGQRVEQTEVLEAITPEGIPDAEVAAYYAAHTVDYQQPEYRRATVIIANDHDGAVHALADLHRARGDMRRVRELVRQYSADDETRGHEGDTFYFQRNGAPSADARPVHTADGGTAMVPGIQGVDPHLADAIFALPREMDAPSEPVPVAGGRFGVAVLTGIRPAMNRTADDPGVVASIRGFIVRERRQQRESQLLEGLRARLHPEIHEELLNQIQLPAADLGQMPGFTR